VQSELPQGHATALVCVPSRLGQVKAVHRLVSAKQNSFALQDELVPHAHVVTVLAMAPSTEEHEATGEQRSSASLQKRPVE